MIFFLTAFVSLFSCKGLFDKDSDDDEKQTEQTTTEQTISTSKEYWGTWIRMDTGNEMYISSDSNVSGYTLDGDNVLKNGSTVYFRKGGSARSFSATVSGFSDSRAARALATGKQGIAGRRENEKNSADSETVTSDSSGRLSFTGAVADDTQKITVSETTTVEVTPSYDGENLGTIPIVEKGTYGFKTTYSIDSDNQGFCFGNYYKTYTLTLNLNNIGSEMCETSMYTVSCSDNNLSFVSGSKSGNFSSIEAGSAKTLSFTVRYGELNSEYVDVPINVSITDSKYERTWEDSITLRFYKGFVRLKVNSRNFDENSSATLKGFLIYPDGRSKRFTVSAGSESTVLVPWSESNYMLAFSGATSSNEMAYSFGFADKTALADLSGTWSIDEIKSYEPNDSTTTSQTVTDLSQPIKSYLKPDDIDFYTINCSSIDVKFEPVSVVSYAVKEYENGNSDGLVTPGESHYLDVKMQNTTSSDISGVSVKLTTTSSYVTIVRDSYTIGDMKAGYYYSLTYSASSESYCYLMDSYYSSRAFKFSLDSSCPDGTQLPFTVTFTDSSGNTWSDTLTIPVN